MILIQEAFFYLSIAMMKAFSRSIGILLLLLLPVFLIILLVQNDKPAPALPVPLTERPGAHEDPSLRGQYEWLRLRNPQTGSIPSRMRSRELAFAKKLSARNLGANKQSASYAEPWSFRGPGNVGGRTRALAIDLNYDGTSNQRILAAGVSGGMFKSEDGGASWELTTALSDLASATAVAQDPTNPDVWYYGTGEFSGNSASGVGSLFRGHGIFKSSDGGNSWSQLPSTIENNDPLVADNLMDYIWDIEVHPTTGAIFVAGWGAILISADEGDSFANTLETFGNNADVEIAADGTVYAALGRDGTGSETYGIFRLTDEGWEDISPVALVADPYRIVLDTAPGDASRLFALVQANAAGATVEDHQFFVFDGQSEMWTELTSALPNVTEPGPNGEEPVEGGPAEFVSQGGYDLLLAVSPDDADVVWIGGTNLYRSTDGGNSFTHVGGYRGPYTTFLYENHHPDQHSMAFFPHVQNALISGHDGGLSYTSNALEASQTWESLNNHYNTSQFYTVAIDPDHLSPNANTLFGGMQDNGTWITSTSDDQIAWEELFGGDGAFAAATSGGETLYVSSQLGYVLRFGNSDNQNAWAVVSPEGASDFLFIAPFVLDPNEESVMYMAAGDLVWRNSNLDEIPNFDSEPTNVNWTALDNASGNGNTVTALAVPVQQAAGKAPADVMYFGEFGDTGSTDLIRVEDPANNGTGISILPDGVIQGSYVSSIVINPVNEDEIVVTFSNYGVPSVFHSNDGGATWSDIEGNLSGDDGPSVRWAGIMPAEAGTLYYLATSTGMYVTQALDGAQTNWTPEAEDLIGNVVVSMIATRSGDGLVVAGTHGRGVYSATVDVSNTVSTESPEELPVRASLSQNYPNPFNPETTIRYELMAPELVELRIFDLAGRSVRVLDAGSKTAGVHEVRWDGTNENGQVVPSGTYLYRLYVEGAFSDGPWSQSGKMTLLK